MSSGPVVVEPRALGTRNEGFRCDFCARPLMAMNTLHTDSYRLSDEDAPKEPVSVSDSSSSTTPGDGSDAGVETEAKHDDGDDGDETRHEGVRLCGECSVGHCPECGTQLVPHLPVDGKQKGFGKGSKASKSENTAGLKTVIWYTQLGRSDLIIQCPNGDYQSVMKVADSGGKNPKAPLGKFSASGKLVFDAGTKTESN